LGRGFWRPDFVPHTECPEQEWHQGLYSYFCMYNTHTIKCPVWLCCSVLQCVEHESHLSFSVICTCMILSTQACTHIHVCMYIYVYNLDVDVCMYVYICIHVHFHTYMYIHLCTYMCIYVDIHMHLFNDLYTYTYVHIQICICICI